MAHRRLIGKNAKLDILWHRIANLLLDFPDKRNLRRFARFDVAAE
jgi:hypothetical protein